MSDARKAEFRRVVDQDGRYLGEIHPRTLEFTRTERGKERRAQLTDYIDQGYKESARRSALTTTDRIRA